jgi:serine protease Do
MRLVKAELIERYCRGELTPDEHRVFGQWMENDALLRNEVAEYMQLADALRYFREKNALKDTLSAIHDDMETESFRTAPILKKVEGGRVSAFSRFLPGTNSRWTGIAATLAIVMVCAALVGIGINRMSATRSQSAYQELRREVESIKRNQSVISAGKRDAVQANPSSGYTGSGIAIDASGFVLTSHHLIAGARSIYISNEEFEQLPMEVVYSDASLDMAVLKVADSAFSGFGEIAFGVRKAEADPGERVYTLGYPREDMVYGEGSISSYTGFEGDSASYQVSIPVNPGNSGGPVFDGQGNLLGIVSGRNANAEGASFAIKSTLILSSIKDAQEPGIRLHSKSNLRGLDRTAQIKRLRKHVFMVKVSN